MSDLAAMSDMDYATNDDTTSTSTVLDGSIPDSHNRLTHKDCPDFQIFLTVCFLAMEDQVNRRDSAQLILKMESTPQIISSDLPNNS